MRVIAGKNRGTKLITAKGMVTRPTDDRLKENVFNLIGPIEKDSKVLDLFAGSGQIGIEFLSRGAGSCTFVDRNAKAIQAIRSNLEKTRWLEHATVIHGDYTLVFRNPSTQFKYIYIDPPYDENKILTNLFHLLKLSDIIGDRTWIIFETIKDFQIDKDFIILKERVYGKRKIIISEVR
ncbi:MAG: 16S rRNA (guanine(966)-N(2))-methyltransferase RsmD [Tissierellia bacterium]|nr:16S rRNA (guanine(966)-N(2))-methyltransferase RsmD [Tissierellia bacterium]